MTFEFILTFIGGIVVGGVIGFFACRYIMKKQVADNPGSMFTDDVLKALLRSAGQTPTPKRLKMMRKQMNDAAKKK